jgi:hypothetical protein
MWKCRQRLGQRDHRLTQFQAKEVLQMRDSKQDLLLGMQQRKRTPQQQQQRKPQQQRQMQPHVQPLRKERQKKQKV